MTSTALIRRKGGKTTDDDGFEVDGWTDIYSALPSWVDNKSTAGSSRRVSVGDVELQLATRVLKCPHDTMLLRDGDLVAMVGGMCDGRFFRLIDPTPTDQKKQQEFEVVETERPEGWT